MNLDEKIKLKQEIQDNNYLLISPFRIRYFEFDLDYKNMNLYLNMISNTNKFCESEIFNLITMAEDRNINQEKKYEFTLIFKGSLSDIPSNINDPADFILDNLDKFIAIYHYPVGFETHEYFCGIQMQEEYYKYSHIYLDMGILSKMLKKHNISYKISTDYSKFLRPGEIDRENTQFVISYNPNKEEFKGKDLTRRLKKENK